MMRFWSQRAFLPVAIFVSILYTFAYLWISFKKVYSVQRVTVAEPLILFQTPEQRNWLVDTEVRYYNLTANRSYHYEFRYELSKNESFNRVILLLPGTKRSCVDWWKFSVGRRILSAMRLKNYSILTVCSVRRTFEYKIPIEQSQEVKWIYKSLQIWTNEVYYAKYKQYPLLYLYGLSRGSHFAGMLCRVLPVQAQIMYIYPGHTPAMTQQSQLHKDLQTRLALDSSFASWFTFKYCYETDSDQCPFGSKTLNLNPVPPTYFVHAINDITRKESEYVRIIKLVSKQAMILGGIILNNSRSLVLHIAVKSNATPSYMQENFYEWKYKPYASKLLYEHYVGYPEFPEQQIDPQWKYRTFWCHPANFLFFLRNASLTLKWTERQRKEYLAYSNDIKKFKDFLTEEFCGDMFASHAIISLDIDKAISWLDEIYQLRKELQVQEFASRLPRIWTYNKSLILPVNYETLHEKAQCSYNDYSNEMYSPEYFIQDFFTQYNQTNNSLLADYYLIPHDLYCFIFFHQLFANFTNEQFKEHVYFFSKNYFEPIISKVRFDFPYWNMTSKPGSNHIIAFTAGRNMGVLETKVQEIISNVIQLGFTGFRQDLLPKTSKPIYLHRNLSIVYRHYYDIVVPPYTPLQFIKINLSRNWYQDKKKLLYFAGSINHTLTTQSARAVLVNLVHNMSSTTIRIGKKEFSSIEITNGHLPVSDYVEAIRSSVFLLCPEGYSPWSPRIYESIYQGAIPLVLADGIVYPFERFIPWRSFSMKLNITNVKDLFDFVFGENPANFEQIVIKKRNNAALYIDAFRWPYKAIGEQSKRHLFTPEGHWNKNVFHYIYQELRCRGIEQLYGASSDVFSSISVNARHKTCTLHSDICPCEKAKAMAFDQFNDG